MKMESWGLCSCLLLELLQVTNIWDSLHRQTSKRKHVTCSSPCIHVLASSQHVLSEQYSAFVTPH